MSPLRPVLAVFLSFLVAVASLAACTTKTVQELAPEAGTVPTEPVDPGDPQLPDPPACEPNCAKRACGTDGCGGTCGSCKTGEKCNTNKGTCSPTCTPSCDGLACGSDGCGGSCGSCSTGTCHDGECQCTKDSDCGPNRVCGQDKSGNHGCSPVCDPFNASTCTGGKGCASFAEDGAGRLIAACVPMGTKIEGEPCVDQPNFAGTDCGPGLTCIKPTSTAASTVCMRFCDAAHACPKAGQSCLQLASGTGVASVYSVCGPPMGPCTPNPCTTANKNVCSVVSGAAQCDCNAGYSPQGAACVKICVPSCAGKTCGPDGCGGSCGACAAGETCTASGSACCAPSCAGRTCGPDGCGGTCGACGAGQICSAAGQCNACVPSCAGKTCGPDGCGGSCGFCGVGICNGAGQCTCSPKCAGKNCGPDGCGGTCGACGGGNTCAAGLCTNPNVCQGSPCYAAYSEGGCCFSSAFCVRGAGQANTYCRNACGKSGEGCRGDNDCCSPFSCFANVCQ